MKTATILVLVALITMKMDTACALSNPKTFEKPGACPDPLSYVGHHLEFCLGDESCPGQWGCSNGCGYDYTLPVFKTANSPVEGFGPYKHDCCPAPEDFY